MGCLRWQGCHARRERGPVDLSCARDQLCQFHLVAHTCMKGAEQTYHLLLDEGLEGVDLSIVLSLHQSDLTESALANNLQGVVVLWLLTSSEESQKVGF